MNQAILTPAVQRFLQEHAHENASSVALKKSPFTEVSSAELANQIESKQKAKKKLPTWYETPGIYFPSPLSIEQSSSERAAAYKAQLIPAGSTLIDLTGGMGVDAFYFAKEAKNVIHCEIEPHLSTIAAYNLRLLGRNNIDFHTRDGLDLLEQLSVDQVDVSYIDPSRRIQTQKVFLLSDCEPNVVLHQHTLRTKAQTCLIKASPLLDIRAALSELQHIQAVHVISVHQEVKEVLFVMERNWAAVPIIIATQLNRGKSSSFSFRLDEEEQATPIFGQARAYIYEPDASLMKAGCFKLISERFTVQKLHLHTHLYTADRLIPNFPGKAFKILDLWDYSEFKKQKTERAASIVSKNFPLKAEALREKHHIKESAQHFLFFFEDTSSQLKTLWAERCVF